jgi:MYXO-CTERM domain-containing protein
MKRLMVGLIAAAIAISAKADAFCGFYVGGGEAKLFNNATNVVLLRDGIRTVLSMQNNYQGPPENFAMVVPVPVVLQKENVKTLPKALFDRVDQIASPRLVEYWEQDPCPPPMGGGGGFGSGHGRLGGAPMPSVAAKASLESQVKIEAQFVVGEYEIVILSATDALALDTWLRTNKYSIPAGAEPFLRPYVQAGMKFFVAKVDVSKVKIENGMAQLSPIRFHYDTEQFHLPIRLGLINSQGSQDLIVNVLGRNQRYDVANYENVAVPTNIDVADATRNQFASFYTKLFEQTLAKHPRAVVTEYSWQATTCDPCPTQPLTMAEIMTLGADVAPSMQPPPQQPAVVFGGGTGAPPPPPPPSRRQWMGGGSDFVLTRLHVRYTKDALGDDLFLRAAPPIVGGREFVTGAGGKLEEGAQPSGTNNYQARYVIRHPWAGAIACAHPQRGVWGGQPGAPWGGPKTSAAAGLGLAKSGNLQLAALVKGTLPGETFLSAAVPTPVLAIPQVGGGDAGVLDVDASAPITNDAGPPGPPPEQPKGGCAGCAVGGEGASSAALGVLALALLRRKRRS